MTLPKQLYNCAELAVLLGLSERTISRHIAAGLIDAVRVGKRRMIRADVVEELLRGGVDLANKPAAG